MPLLNDENRYKLLKLLADNPDMSQRQIANALGISLGKANFCVHALIEKGWVKAGQLRGYKLTFRGMDEKAKVTLRFLQRKMREYEALEQEIAELQAEAKELSTEAQGYSPSLRPHVTPDTDPGRGPAS